MSDSEVPSSDEDINERSKRKCTNTDDSFSNKSKKPRTSTSSNSIHKRSNDTNNAHSGGGFQEKHLRTLRDKGAIADGQLISYLVTGRNLIFFARLDFSQSALSVVDYHNLVGPQSFKSLTAWVKRVHQTLDMTLKPHTEVVKVHYQNAVISVGKLEKMGKKSYYSQPLIVNLEVAVQLERLISLRSVGYLVTEKEARERGGISDKLLRTVNLALKKPSLKKKKAEEESDVKEKKKQQKGKGKEEKRSVASLNSFSPPSDSDGEEEAKGRKELSLSTRVKHWKEKQKVKKTKQDKQEKIREAVEEDSNLEWRCTYDGNYEKDGEEDLISD